MIVRNYLLLLAFCLSTVSVAAQVSQGEQLSKSEIADIFTSEQKHELGIEFDIYRVYSYTDRSGSYYFVMTENQYDVNNDTSNPMFNAIKGYCIKNESGTLSKQWSLRDFIKKPSGDDEGEHSIWFWSKYCLFSDLDHDGLIEPILVYGTFGSARFDNGRIKILTYYKGVKKAIRHQNGILDDERNTQVDASFYKLPSSIQQEVQKIMNHIMDNNHGIFPAGWEKAMEQKKGFFDEN